MFHKIQNPLYKILKYLYDKYSPPNQSQNPFPFLRSSFFQQTLSTWCNYQKDSQNIDNYEGCIRQYLTTLLQNNNSHNPCINLTIEKKIKSEFSNLLLALPALSLPTTEDPYSIMRDGGSSLSRTETINIEINGTTVTFKTINNNNHNNRNKQWCPQQQINYSKNPNQYQHKTTNNQFSYNTSINGSNNNTNSLQQQPFFNNLNNNSSNNTNNHSDNSWAPDTSSQSVNPSSTGTQSPFLMNHHNKKKLLTRSQIPPFIPKQLSQQRNMQNLGNTYNPSYENNNVPSNKITTNNSIEKNQCKHCDKTFRDQYDLKVHIRTHTGEKPYKCKHCDKAFKTNSHLAVHKRTHTGKKPFQCSYKDCNKRFITNSNLKVHTKIHTREKPYKCNFCNKAFAQECDLTKHIGTHTGEKPFKCTTCDRAFKKNSNLMTHIRTHTGEKPHKCDQCQKRFTTKGSLNNHVRSEHEKKRHKCNDPNCKKSFTTAGSLKRHIKNQHKKSKQ